MIERPAALSSLRVAASLASTSTTRAPSENEIEEARFFLPGEIEERPPAQEHPSGKGQGSTVVKIIDFDTVEPWSPEIIRVRRNVVGTDHYIAQEAYGGNYSPASDVFAVGVIAYRLITGRFPFRSALFGDCDDDRVGSPKLQALQRRLQNFEINFAMESFEAEPLAADFCRRMLACNGAERPCAADALKHAWLADVG